MQSGCWLSIILIGEEFVKTCCQGKNQRIYGGKVLSVVNVICHDLHRTVWKLHVLLWQESDTYTFGGLQVTHLKRDMLTDSENVSIHCCEIPSWRNHQFHSHICVISGTQHIRQIIVKLHCVLSWILSIQEYLWVCHFGEITQNPNVLQLTKSIPCNFSGKWKMSNLRTF